MGIVRLRLARFGCKHRPFYRLVATDSRAKRDGRHLERLGYYDPLAVKDGEKEMRINIERIKYWLSVGAQPTDTVKYLLSKGGLPPSPPTSAMNRKGGRRNEVIIDPSTGRPVATENNRKKISDIEDDSSVWEQV